MVNMKVEVQNGKWKVNLENVNKKWKLEGWHLSATVPFCITTITVVDASQGNRKATPTNVNTAGSSGSDLHEPILQLASWNHEDWKEVQPLPYSLSQASKREANKAAEWRVATG